jgi:hypothetical protein
VDLVFHKVGELQHVHHADGYRAIELFTSPTVIEIDLAIYRQAGLDQCIANLLFVRHRRTPEWPP